MAHIAPIDLTKAPPEERARFDALLADFGSVTNMKATLVRSQTALEALLQWYPLHDRALAILGKRLTTVFAHAISTGSECLLCSTYFRRELIAAGEDPAGLELSEREAAVAEFGVRLATRPNEVDDELFSRLKRFYDDTELVDITAFAALMIATNVFNSGLRVDLDQSLEPFRAPRLAEVRHG